MNGAAPESPPPQGPLGSYYVDFTHKAAATGSPAAAAARLAQLVADRERANPVTVAQLGLGACQLGGPWHEVAIAAAGWLADQVEDDGRVLYRFAMPHTFRLEPPWASAMAQGQVASLFLRAAPGLEEAAFRVARPLLEPRDGLVVPTPEGPVLQEYPTDPPAHVLNGWIFALWGLNDVGAAAQAAGEDGRAHAAAFAEGCLALARRLGRYRTPYRWSRYDLFPHPLTNVSSPAYHRLHVEQLRVMSRLSPHSAFEEIAAEWASGVGSAASRGLALARKAAFRAVRPRSAIGRRLLRT